MATYAHGMHATYTAPWLKDLDPELARYCGPEEVMIEEVIDTGHGDVIVVRPLGSDTLIETSAAYLSDPTGTPCQH